MLSVLPPPCEDAAWGPCLGEPLRKRPAPPSCLGEYHSVSGRAKRLRQELLRLRQWEQQVHQESTGAREGQADSCDASFMVEPSASALLLSPDLRHPICGAASCVAPDACDSTASPVHGLPLARASDACRCPHPARLPDPGLDLPGAHAAHAGLQRQAASNPTQLRPNASPVAVQNGKTLSLPPRLALAAASQPSAVTPAPRAPAAHPEQRGRRCQGGPTSRGADPRSGLWATSNSEGASVQQSEPRGGQGHGAAAAGASRGLLGLAEEDSPREETSPPRRLTLKPSEAPEGARDGVPAQALRSSDSSAAAAGCLALPPLPRQYLGMPTATRLRLLEFFLQAADLLGLGLPSLYLAAVMLDCCWVEEGMRVKRVGSGAHSVPSGAHSVPSYEAEAGPLLSLSGEHLQVTALACLLHAFRCAATPSASSAEAFVRRLSAGSCRSPRVAAMLPVRAAALEECLTSLARRMPLGWASSANSAASASGLLWTVLELRFGASQRQHLGLFVAHLGALGFQRLPSAVLAAASGCLVPTDAPHQCTADKEALPDLRRAAGGGFTGKHLEVLQDFLCPSMKGALGNAFELGVLEPCSHAEEQCFPEPSEEISI